jgi:hypothetical protein
MITAQDAPRRENLFTAIAGYISGHAWLPSEWHHLGWLAVAGLVAVQQIDLRRTIVKALRSPGILFAGLFLTWMTLRSVSNAAFATPHPIEEMMRGLIGIALLILLVILLWEISDDVAMIRRIGKVSGAITATAAAASIILYNFVLTGHILGERLSNIFVHGGQNPVCAGLIFGFNGLWLCQNLENEPQQRSKTLLWIAATVLHCATFLTGSRGAMLSLLVGHLVLCFVRGWRRGWPVMVMFTVVASTYLIAARNFVGASRGTSLAGEVISRGDNGRFEIYAAGWKSLVESDAFIIGIGEWGTGPKWAQHLPPDPSGLMHHLHSVIISTGVHGGLIGLALAGIVFFCAANSAWKVRKTQPDLIALLGYGAAGLSVDGQTLCSLASLPRFEGLLFWVPVILALRATLVEIRGFEPLTFSLRTRRSTN